MDLKQIPLDITIFNSKFVNEIKNEDTDKTFEKSRLIVQEYNNADKILVVTELPTIEQLSWRFIISLATILQDNDIKLFFQDITQVYVQFTSYLNRKLFIEIIIKLIDALAAKLLYILKVMKPLYSISKVSNH